MSVVRRNVCFKKQSYQFSKLLVQIHSFFSNFICLVLYFHLYTWTDYRLGLNHKVNHRISADCQSHHFQLVINSNNNLAPSSQWCNSICNDDLSLWLGQHRFPWKFVVLKCLLLWGKRPQLWYFQNDALTPLMAFVHDVIHQLKRSIVAYESAIHQIPASFRFAICFRIIPVD